MQVYSSFINTELLRVIPTIDLISFFFETSLLGSVELLCWMVHFFILNKRCFFSHTFPPVLLWSIEFLNVWFFWAAESLGCEELCSDFDVLHGGLVLDLWELFVVELFECLVKDIPVLEIGLLIVFWLFDACVLVGYSSSAFWLEKCRWCLHHWWLPLLYHRQILRWKARRIIVWSSVQQLMSFLHMPKDVLKQILILLTFESLTVLFDVVSCIFSSLRKWDS